MAETTVSPQDQDGDTALYAGAGDTPRAARLRRSLVRKFATTPAFMGQSANNYPHLAADVAMQVLGYILEEAAEEAAESERRLRAVVPAAAEETLAARLQVAVAAARASERAACIAQLRAEASALAAVALESRGPDAAVAARDATALAAAARSMASQPASA